MKNDMKKVVLSILCVLMVTSCATQACIYSVRDQKPKKEYIEDYSEKMEILKMDFPEVYKLFCDGKVRLHEMYTVTDRKGRKRVKFNYSYVTP